jgi:hypothetical protein
MTVFRHMLCFHTSEDGRHCLQRKGTDICDAGCGDCKPNCQHSCIKVNEPTRCIHQLYHRTRCIHHLYHKARLTFSVTVTYELVCSLLTNKCTFCFRISVQFTLHMFRPWLSHHHGTLISSLHCSLVHLVLSQPLHCLRLLFILAITGIKNFFKFCFLEMNQWTVKRTYQCTPDDGRVTAETCVGWLEQKYENKKCISWLINWKLMSRCTANTTWH